MVFMDILAFFVGITILLYTIYYTFWVICLFACWLESVPRLSILVTALHATVPLPFQFQIRSHFELLLSSDLSISFVDSRSFYFSFS